MPVQDVWTPMQQTIEASPSLIKSWADHIEATAEDQLNNVARLPFIYKHVAVMPDVHAGIGATIGSVIATDGAIIPSAVGVDIGCGVSAYKTGYHVDELPMDLSELRELIEASIPHGRTDNGGEGDVGAWFWGEIPAHVNYAWASRVSGDFPFNGPAESPSFSEELWCRAQRQLGTLGGGNHYVELCVDEEGHVWIVIHSGSRGIGNFIGKHYIQVAKNLMEKYFINLPDPELAYLPAGTPEFSSYLFWMDWALHYARNNRSLMLDVTAAALEEVTTTDNRKDLPTLIECHHNYAAKENHFGKNVWVTRKGAIRARKGDFGIIPEAMGGHSYIVEGLGNKDSFCSASHGAGRVKGRRQAKRDHTLSELQASMVGVECAVTEGMIDEIKSAYKDLDEVMECQTDLVSVKHKLTPLICIKGGE